jgi:nitrogenase molybdenum-cofactor synthesis protein NifE
LQHFISNDCCKCGIFLFNKKGGKAMKQLETTGLLDERRDFVCLSGDKSGLKCESNSVAGAISQRACVYCGARVVLNPITDAYHIIHGPIGCASYTWDLRGSLTSGSETYRNAFSTDLQEKDVIFGGGKKLAGAIDEIVAKFAPKLIFVYATCIVGVIGDDVEAICKAAEQKHGIICIPVKSPGFSGNKSTGYRLACNALLELMSRAKPEAKQQGINILGDFNLSGEMWIISEYLKRIGVNIVSRITGDSTSDEIMHAPTAALNIVQCAGSMGYLAGRMEELYGIPFIKVSFFGIEDTTSSILRIAYALRDKAAIEKAKRFTEEKSAETARLLEPYKALLQGKRAAIYVGGGYKAISLIRQFRELLIDTVMVGTQTGKPDEYEVIRGLADPGTVILDDANPAELEKFMRQTGADILVGGVKERPLAYKLAVAFCDHNHERKQPLAGYDGAVNFAKEINRTVNSPVFTLLKQEAAV